MNKKAMFQIPAIILIILILLGLYLFGGKIMLYILGGEEINLQLDGESYIATSQQFGSGSVLVGDTPSSAWATYATDSNERISSGVSLTGGRRCADMGRSINLDSTSLDLQEFDSVTINSEITISTDWGGASYTIGMTNGDNSLSLSDSVSNGNTGSTTSKSTFYFTITDDGSHYIINDVLNNVNVIDKSLLDGEKEIFININANSLCTGQSSALLALHSVDIEMDVEPPVVPQPNGWSVVWSKIWDWILNLFSNLLTITGASDVTPGEVEDYNINLVAPSPRDSDYNDGTYSVRYANWALVDKNQNVIEEGDWEEVDDAYTKLVGIQIPVDYNEYILVATMTEINGTASGNTWTWSNEEVLMYETFSLRSTAPLPNPPGPSGWAVLWSKIWNWILSLFGL